MAIYEGKKMYNPDEKSKELVWFYIHHYTYIGQNTTLMRADKDDVFEILFPASASLICNATNA